MKEKTNISVNWERFKNEEEMTSELLKNSSMTLDEIGMLMVLLSFCKNNKKFSFEEVVNVVQNGRHSIRGAFDKLITKGYVSRINNRVNGRISYLYILNF